MGEQRAVEFDTKLGTADGVVWYDSDDPDALPDSMQLEAELDGDGWLHLVQGQDVIVLNVRQTAQLMRQMRRHVEPRVQDAARARLRADRERRAVQRHNERHG